MKARKIAKRQQAKAHHAMRCGGTRDVRVFVNGRELKRGTEFGVQRRGRPYLFARPNKGDSIRVDYLAGHLSLRATAD